MNELKQKIKLLESDMDEDQVSLKSEYSSLKQCMERPAFAAVALLGSFMVGYLFSRKRTRKQLVYKSIMLPFFISRISRKIKLLSSITFF